MHRRKFILSSTLAVAAAASPSFPIFSATKAQRKFKLALNPGIIGVKANFAQTLDYAIKYGYEAISPFTQEVMKDYSPAQMNEIMAKMKANKIS